MRTLVGFIFSTALVVPGAWASNLVTYLTPGVGVDAVPISPARVAGDEFQQVYSSSLFSSTATIDSVAFSSSAHVGGDATTLSGNAVITLSTTTLTPGVPGVWSLGNEGSDKTVVFSGLFSTSVLHNSTFDVVFGLTTQFLFDPSAGNLLLDFKWVTTPSMNGALDLSASYSSALVGSNSNTSQYGNFGAADTGVATQFGEAPEPGSWLLSGMALVGCGLGLRIGRRRIERA